MKQRKIVDLIIEISSEEGMFKYPRHIITLTYEDTTQKKVVLLGNELSLILNKSFESISLEGIIIDGQFTGQFKLETTLKGYFGNYRPHYEILNLRDVIDLFNERCHLVDLDNRKNLLDYNDNSNHDDISESPANDVSEDKNTEKWITKSYDPATYCLRRMSDKKLVNNVIEIVCDDDCIAYRLIGLDKKEISGLIKKEDIDQPLPLSASEMMDDEANRNKWLNLILDVTTKRGQSNPDHVPPKVEVNPSIGNKIAGDDSLSQHIKEVSLSAARNVVDALFPPPQVYYDKNTKRCYVDDSMSMKQVGLFAVKTAAVALSVYAVSQGLKR